MPKVKDVSALEKAISNGISNDAAWITFLETLRTSRALAKELPAMTQLLISIPDMKSACGRLAAHFEIVTRKCPTVAVQISLFDEMLSNREPKGLHGYEASGAKTHAITYPKAKGREFDIVVMVVDPRHESSQPPLDERRRLYYVCATRARKLLLVIHYKSELGPVLGPVLKPL